MTASSSHISSGLSERNESSSTLLRKFVFSYLLSLHWYDVFCLPIKILLNRIVLRLTVTSNNFRHTEICCIGIRACIGTFEAGLPFPV